MLFEDALLISPGLHKSGNFQLTFFYGLSVVAVYWLAIQPANNPAIQPAFVQVFRTSLNDNTYGTKYHIFFNQHLGAAHSKRWPKYAF